MKACPDRQLSQEQVFKNSLSYHQWHFEMGYNMYRMVFSKQQDPDSIYRCHLTSIFKSHCGDKTVERSSYLHNGIFYTGKMASFFLYKTLFLRNYIRLHTTSSYQIDGPAKTETTPLLMHWNRLSPIPKSSR